RGLYNQILASQDPASGMFTYFVPLVSGNFKTYSTPTNSFWCCVGTGMENHAKYGDTIYFHTPDSLYVNLFIASELNWKEKGIIVRQETNFPDEEKTTLTMQVTKPVKLALKIRRPAGAGEGAKILVNGKPQKIKSEPSSYITLERKWRSGDRIEFTLPMRVHVEDLPNDPTTVAVLYGPIVLAAKMGTEGLPPNGQQAKSQLDFAGMKLPHAPVLNTTNVGKIISQISRDEKAPLTFHADGLVQPGTLELLPFYRVHHERYSIYFNLPTPPRQSSRDD
ncbi:MAG: beta-L-arabinofuranosidase domain-containing protein, partial [Limisphaerales bacterium]